MSKVSILAVAIAILSGGLVLPADAAGSSPTQPFTLYPAFVHRHAVVEAATDKGLVVELIVRCPGGAGILTYSKVERRYCGPDHQCAAVLDDAVRRLCQ